MKDSRKYIKILLILIVIIIILIFIISVVRKEKNKREIIENPELTLKAPDTIVDEDKVEFITSKADYLRINNCLTQFITTINKESSKYYAYNENNEYVKVAENNEIKQNLLNVLSEEYIQNKSITLENVTEHIYDINQGCLYIPITINQVAETENVRTFEVYGVVEKLGYEPVGESYLILNIDILNDTFSIEIVNSEGDFEDKEYSNIEAIENKGNNIYNDPYKMNEETIETYMSNYKKVALAYPEIAYEYFLDNNYKKAKFGSVDNYKKYVEENREKIMGIVIDKYQVNEQNGYTQFIGIDKDENQYFFNSTTGVDFKLLLDYYTVDIPQFTEKYNVASDTEKIAYNIQKCLDAMNNDDYAYMYSKLSENFKNSNYSTKEEFREFLSQKLFDKNEITDISAELEGEVYVCDVTISNKNNTKETKKITIIMQLNEGTDFVMSFNVE